MKKRIIALILTACTLLNLTAGCGGKKDPDSSTGSPSPTGDGNISAVTLSADQTFMTRAEWIALLGSAMGMEEYTTQDPHFSDVGPEAAYFPYIQSTFEWGVLDFESDPFRPDEMATREFVAVTAVLASGVKSSQDSTVSDLSVFAESRGVVSLSQGDWDSGVMLAEGRVAAEVAKQLYLSDHDQEVNETTMAEGVKDLRSVTDGSLRMEEGTLVMPAAMAAELAEGDVVLLPGTQYDPYGVAMKITGMELSGDSAYLTTEEPDLGEVFTDINVSAQVAPTREQVILADGVQLESYTALSSTEGAGRAVFLSEGGEQPKGVNLGFDVKFKSEDGGKVSVSAKWEDHKVTVEETVKALPKPEEATGDGEKTVTETVHSENSKEANDVFNDTNYILPENGEKLDLSKESPKKVLKVDPKFEKSYEITGKVEFKNFYVIPTFEFHKLWGIPTGIDRAAVEINYDLVSSLSLKGTLEGELTIATIPVQVGASPVTVELQLKLFANASGELELKWEIGNNVKFEYSHGNIMKTQTGHQSQNFKVAIELEAGAKFDVLLKIASIRIIDVGVSATAKAKGEGYLECKVTEELTTVNGASNLKQTYEYLMGLETVVSLPIVKLKVGYEKSLANKLNIKYEWTLISEENAPIKWKPEFANKKWPILTITIEGPTEKTEPEEFPPPEEEEDKFAIYQSITIDKMLMNLNLSESDQIQVNSLPENTTFDQVSFTSQNPSVATVDSDGTVTAKGPGLTQIWAQTPDGGLQICLVTVVEDYSIKDGSFL